MLLRLNRIIILMNYTAGVAAATFTIAFLVFLGILVFGVVAIAAFVSFPMFDLDYCKAGLLWRPTVARYTK